MPRILIVDDEPAIRSLLRRALEDSGHHVIEADDGAAGLEQALRERPDAVLLDIALPRLSGLEVCRWLRRHRATAATPVLLITGVAAEGEQAAAQVGAAGCLTKPFSPAEVAARLETLLVEQTQVAR